MYKINPKSGFVRVNGIRLHYLDRKRKLTDDYTDEQKEAFDKFHREVMDPFCASIIDDFQRRFPQAKIITIPNGLHYCFIAHKEYVHDEMLKFMLE